MQEPDFWTSCAEAMELSVEGNRLIANELADAVRKLWRRAMQSLDAAVRSQDSRPHLPPL